MTTLSDTAKATALVAAGLACVVGGGIVGSHIPPIVIVSACVLLLVLGVLALVGVIS